MRKGKILIIDDDVAYALQLRSALEGTFSVEVCHSESEFRERFVIGRYDLLIMDMRLVRDHEGLVLMREVQVADPLQAAIVMTAYADIETYADALEAGAMTYLDKREFSPTLIARTVEAIVAQARMRRRVSDLEDRLEAAEPHEFIGASPIIRRVRESLRRATEIDGPIFLVGEPGVGKELAAHNIHRLSRRRSEGPFVRVACDRFRRDELFERLFGGVRGMAKGPSLETKGWIDDARGGILLLQNTLGLDDAFWVALAELLESGTFVRLGGKKRFDADMQVIVAVDPKMELTVRETMARVGGLWISLPALREHTEDIAPLAQYLLQNIYREGRTQVRSLRGTALAVLESLPWPGNVQELKSSIAYAASLADVEAVREIGPGHLPLIVAERTDIQQSLPPLGDFQKHLARAEIALVESAIQINGSLKKEELASRLGYNDRFVFMRRVRKALSVYPELQLHYPKAAELAEPRKKHE